MQQIYSILTSFCKISVPEKAGRPTVFRMKRRYTAYLLQGGISSVSPALLRTEQGAYERNEI